MSYNTILATAPLTTQNYHLKMIGTTIGNSLIWDNGTNVGIGNTNTSYTLDVSGTIRATGSIYGDVGFRTKSLNGYQLKNDADSANLGGLVRRSYWAGGAALDTQIFAETGYGIYLNVNGSVTSGMTITSAGNVGIGTSSPAEKLNVVVSANGNNTRFDGPTSGLIFQTNATSTDIISYGGTTPAYRQMNFATGASTAMSITSTEISNKTGVIALTNATGGVPSTGAGIRFNGTFYIYGGANGFNVRNNANSINLLSIADIGTFNTGTATESPYNLTLAASANCHIYSDGTLFRATSSVRYKTDIEDFNVDTFDLINKIRPVWYRSLCERDKKDWSWYGFIAEELAEIDPRFVQFGYASEDYIKDEETNETKLKEGAELRADGVMYDRLTVLLIKGMQEQQAQIEELSNRLIKLESK